MKFITDRNLTIINFAIVFYFLLIYLIHKYQVDFVIIGVFRELLSIPFLIAQIVFVIIGINHLIKQKIRLLNVVSLFALVICSIITLSSFF
jgi:hypothetical protein